MPHKDPIVAKEYRKQWRIKNKEKIKHYRQDNKEKIAAYSKEYREENKETLAAQKKEWGQKNKEYLYKQHRAYRDANKSKYAIYEWERSGMIDSHWDLLYDAYMKETHCWICDIEYEKTTRLKCLDHDHDTGEVRYICCSVCNCKVIG